MYVFISLFIAVAAHPNLRQLTHEFRASIDSIDKTDDLDAWVNEANRYVTESLSDLSTNNQGQHDLSTNNQGQNDLSTNNQGQNDLDLSTNNQVQNDLDLFSKHWQQQTDMVDSGKYLITTTTKQSSRGPGFWPN